MDRTVKEMAKDINVYLNHMYRYVKNKKLDPLQDIEKKTRVSTLGQSLDNQIQGLRCNGV